MKILISVTFLIFISSFSFAQKGYHTVKFKVKPTPFKAYFKFSGIVDQRLIKENIGFAQKGLSNRRMPARLNGDFETVIGDQVNKIIVDDAAGEQVFFLIHEFNIDEQTSAMSEKGTCRIEIEFAKQEDSTYFSLGTFSSVIEEGGMDVTGKHDNRIMQGLKECILQFERSDWMNQELVEIVAREKSKIAFDFTKVPEEGMYATFGLMAENKPMEDFPIKFNQKKIKSKSKPISKYELEVVNKEDKHNKVLFISDGTDIFMHASRYSTHKYYIKSKHFGKYSLFEDRLSSSNGGFLFGAAGVLASIRTVGIILDTSSGEVFRLSEKTLYPLVKDHKEILEGYKNSKRKRADMEQAIVALNKKLNEVR